MLTLRIIMDVSLDPRCLSYIKKQNKNNNNHKAVYLSSLG